MTRYVIKITYQEAHKGQVWYNVKGGYVRSRGPFYEDETYASLGTASAQCKRLRKQNDYDAKWYRIERYTAEPMAVEI